MTLFQHNSVGTTVLSACQHVSIQLDVFSSQRIEDMANGIDRTPHSVPIALSACLHLGVRIQKTLKKKHSNRFA